jgi:zinc protease
VFEKLKQEIKEEELTKVKNQAQSSHVFGEIEVMNRAMNLAFASLSGDSGLVNKEADLIASVTKEELVSAAKSILREENCNVLYYLKEN